MTWHVRITYTGTITPDETATAAEHLTDYSPAFTINRDGGGGSIALFVDADDTLAAHAQALEAAAGFLGGRVVDTVEIQPEAAFMAGYGRPPLPEMVSYAEIAEMAGLSRQRIRQLAGSPGFPAPVTETTQGPLMLRPAAERWVRTRQARTGRPPRQEK